VSGNRARTRRVAAASGPDCRTRQVRNSDRASGNQECGREGSLRCASSGSRRRYERRGSEAGEAYGSRRSRPLAACDQNETAAAQRTSSARSDTSARRFRHVKAPSLTRASTAAYHHGVMPVRLGRARTILATLLLAAIAASGVLAGLTHLSGETGAQHDRHCPVCHWASAFVGAALPAAPPTALPLKPQAATEIFDSAPASQHAPAPRSSRAPPAS